jgi:hypothetical protein
MARGHNTRVPPKSKCVVRCLLVVMAPGPGGDPALQYSLAVVTRAPAFQFEDNETTREDMKALAPKVEAT